MTQNTMYTIIRPHLVADSRSVYDPAGTTFAAIRTEVGDGHRFIPELYSRGVRSFIVEDVPEDAATAMTEAHFIHVKSVPEALASIARERLDEYEGGIVVTGSVGKTKMKELLYQALASQTTIRRSPRSWNSAIGIPLAIHEMTAAPMPRHIITEAAIDAPGQGSAIARILGSSHKTGILTPITTEHDEAFGGDHRAKILEKLAILSGCSTILYADTDPEVGATIREVLPSVQAIAVRQRAHPSIYHALAAETLSLLGYNTDCVDSIPLIDTRRRIAEGSYGNTIYRDNFTADTRSLTDALDFMRRHTTPLRPRVLIVGDMMDHPDAPEIERLAASFDINAVYHIDDTLANHIYHREIADSQVLLIGARTQAMDRVAEALEAAGHSTELVVDLDAMIHNFNYYRSLVPKGTGIVAMVKASAYGMGAVEIAKALQSAGAAYLAVAVIEEGIMLRQAGVTMPIMVLNPVTNRYPALFAHRIEPAVFSADELRRLIAEAEACGVKDYPVHIKLDTGMHRVGFTESQLDQIVPLVLGTDTIAVRSVFTHLATADCLDMDTYTLGQIERFEAMCDRLDIAIGSHPVRHILNTAGMMRLAGATHYGMARLGIGLYGISPLPADIPVPLRPIAAFRSHIISLKHWPADTPIGYGGRGRTTSDAVIATVPVGYADGINRHLGCGATTFTVGGVPCPTIGNICMDQCMIDVTAVPDVAVGDTVEIFGPSHPVEAIAGTLGTIPYEVLTSVSPRVKRTYITR